MASTLTAYAAFEYSKKFIGNMDLDRMLPRLLDDVSKMFWVYAPWRWTLSSLTPITLISNTQDYNVTLPADFLYLYDVLQLDGKTTRHIKPSAIFPSTGSSLRGGQIGSAAIMNTGAQYFLRVDPTPGTIPASSPAEKLVSIYKQLSPTIDLGSMYTAGALLIPDEFYWVYLEGVMWRAMQWAQDPRAGAVEVKQGQAVYSGQRAAFEAAMQTCMQQEKLYESDPQEEQR